MSIRRFDPILLFATVGLLLFSIAAVGESRYPELASRQTIFVVLGLIVMFAVSRVDVLRMRELKYGHYGLVIFGLILILIFGSDVNGARLAIIIGPIQIQWSEFAKILFALAVAAELVDRQRQIAEWSTMLRILAFTAPVLMLVMLQPDLGSAMVYVVMVVLMLAVAGIPALQLRTLIATGVALIVLVIGVLPAAGVSVLQEYQMDRLTSFLNPGDANSDEAYQQGQAVIAIGAGGRTGQGENATQAKFGFTPESQTDFIYSVIGERWGFVGAGLVLLLYSLVLWRVLRILLEARSTYEAIFVSGVIGMLSFQIFENVGMNLGIMPITGVTLPLLSYGGSSVIATLTALGLVHAVHAHAASARDPRIRLQPA